MTPEVRPTVCPACGSDRRMANRPCSTGVILSGMESMVNPWHSEVIDTPEGESGDAS